jgi:cell wall-associated NlpC family hydrolase
VNTRALATALLTLTLMACATPVAKHVMTPSAPPAIDASIVGRATQMLGQPYQWGGAAPGGFDCSGLVVYATHAVGLKLPRTAAEQLHAGVPVARRDLRAGDLVFMHLARKELHVGIAIDAEHFVHAPATGGRVRIDSLTAKPYSRGFFQARRVT